MFESDGNLELYMQNGREAVDLMKRYCESPGRILDFACGHGRVVRHIVAEWPEAEVFASDVWAEAVAFCECEFGVQGIESANDAENVPALPLCDLIWVGSLFTHLDVPKWRDFFRLLESALAPSGVLILTTHGDYAAQIMRPQDNNQELLEQYDRTGFGYVERPWGWPGYGGSLSTSAWVRGFIRDETGLSVVEIEERGWIHVQDVVCCVGPS
jgi:SAM-dependent methyltransferase